jgi:D-alanine-D-alanine ligase
MTQPIVSVFRGGTSRERDVSLGSGAAALAAFAKSRPVIDRIIDRQELPADFNPGREVVFSTLHGTFGEDGHMQRLLEAAGAAYTGCDAVSSALCFDKQATKERVSRAGVRTARGLSFSASARPETDEIVAKLGASVVFKPRAEGSSVGLRFAEGPSEIAAALAELHETDWLCEERIIGRELTVGMLGGKSLGIVEIRPKSGRFDFESKYTKGLTEYLCPADLSPTEASGVRAAAEAAFAACSCRDYARIDFILPADAQPCLLEINTLPGLKETSLLPMSARACGHDFPGLLEAMLAPALARHSNKN